MQPSNSTALPHSGQPFYLLVINGKPEGPFSLHRLKELDLRPGDFVKTPGMDDYKEAHEIAELRAFFGFGKPDLIPQYFGSFDQRLLASALDWFFVAGAFILTAFILTLFITGKTARLSIAFGLLILIPLAKFVYHIILESSARQATYGKQVLRIKVCDLQGRRLSLAHSAGRNAAKIFSVLPFFTGYLLSFFNKRQQCLHDMLANTLVMKDRLF